MENDNKMTKIKRTSSVNDQALSIRKGDRGRERGGHNYRLGQV
jgi:hypothetical protein